MIIADESHKDPLIPKIPQAGESSTGQPPPPYSPHTRASANPYGNVSHAQPAPAPVVAVYRQSPGGRFLRAFAVAALIWFLVGAFSRSIFGLTHRGWHHHHQDEWDLPLPAEQIERCVDKTGWRKGDNSNRNTWFPYYATTSFNLPADSDLLFMIAQGALSSGHFEVVESSTSETVEVDITARYYFQDLLETANICLLKREGYQHGVGIFTPKHWEKWSRNDQLQFEFTIRLPTSKRSSPLQIKGLETRLPLFSHKLGNLSDKVEFQSLSLTSTNMPIDVQSVYADSAIVQTLNGPITGSFKTSTRLELLTVNAPIKVDVELGSNSSRLTDLRMKTSNGPLEANISLLCGSSSGGNYSVSAINSNGRISVGFPKSPIDSTLLLVASSTYSPVSVTLNPAYEGSFSASTTPFSKVFLDARKVDDPAGKNRKRIMVPIKDRNGLIDGRVWWGNDKKKTKSWVKVKTLNSDAFLTL